MLMESASFNEKLKLLQSMGYHPTVAKNALEAADGNVEAAVGIIMADETNQTSATSAPPTTTGTMNRDTASPSTLSSMKFWCEGKTTKEVLKHYSQQMLGGKHLEVWKKQKRV